MAGNKKEKCIVGVRCSGRAGDEESCRRVPRAREFRKVARPGHVDIVRTRNRCVAGTSREGR